MAFSLKFELENKTVKCSKEEGNSIWYKPMIDLCMFCITMAHFMFHMFLVSSSSHKEKDTVGFPLTSC